MRILFFIMFVSIAKSFTAGIDMEKIKINPQIHLKNTSSSEFIRISSGRNSNDDTSDVHSLINVLESLILKGSITENLLINYPSLPRIKYTKLKKELMNSIINFEIAIATLTEKYRREFALYLDESGNYWLSLGSPTAVLPPNEAIWNNGLTDLIFHTHPKRGIVRASSGDIASSAYDTNDESYVISMSGYKCKITSNGQSDAKRFFTPKSYDMTISPEKIRIDMLIEKHVSSQEKFFAFTDYLKKHPNKKEEVKPELEKLLQFVSNQSDDYYEIKHSAVLNEPLSDLINKELMSY